MASLDTLLARATSSVPRPTAAQQELLVRLSRLRARLDEGLFRVAMLGQFKRGKSRLLGSGGLCGCARFPGAKPGFGAHAKARPLIQIEVPL
jgi:hypothetical protein